MTPMIDPLESAGIPPGKLRKWTNEPGEPKPEQMDLLKVLEM